MKLALLSRLTAAPTTRARSLSFLASLFWLDVKASLQLASGGFPEALNRRLLDVASDDHISLRCKRSNFFAQV